MRIRRSEVILPPSKFTVDIRQRIIDALSEGHSHETAALLAGIQPGTLSKWLTRGRESDKDSIYRRFAEDCAVAEGANRGRCLHILNKAMVDQPKWAAWFLERRDPAFAPPTQRPTERQVQPVVIALQLPGGTKRVANLAQPELA
jgi:transposase-like protein